jgi:uroporphyrinogen-III synthase
MLEIKNLHVNVDGREILKGLDLTLPAGEVHAITFASPSAVEAFVAGLGTVIWDEVPGALVVLSIGPTTSAALRAAGRHPDGEAAEPSSEALAEVLVSALRERSP